MILYGLIGYPLSHSFSKKYFTEKFEKEHIENHQYELFPIERIDDLPSLLARQPLLRGLNITIPYKIDVKQFLDRVDADAAGVGAVNCIRISPKKAGETSDAAQPMASLMLEGFNTDTFGFETSLKPLLQKQPYKALVLGNGGAARAVKYVLTKMRIPFKVITRKPAADTHLFDTLTEDDIANHQLIINTTPLGTYPDVNECPPIPYAAVGSKHILYDLIYNPAQTLFLSKGLENGAVVKNGYEMLVLQAERSWEIWNAKTKL